MEERASSEGWRAEAAGLGKGAGLVGMLEEEREGGGVRRGRWMRETEGGGGGKGPDRSPAIVGAAAPVPASPPAGGLGGIGVIAFGGRRQVMLGFKTRGDHFSEGEAVFSLHSVTPPHCRLIDLG